MFIFKKILSKTFLFYYRIRCHKRWNLIKPYGYFTAFSSTLIVCCASINYYIFFNSRQKNGSHVNFYSHNPLVLLKLSQSQLKQTRLLGVQTLSQDHKWNDAEFLTISQGCNAQTLLGLARTKNASHKLIPSLPQLPLAQSLVNDMLRRLVLHLPIDSVDECTKYFTSKALGEGHIISEEQSEVWSFDNNSLLQPISAHTNGSQSLHYHLLSFISHSNVASHCAQIVRFGGLQVLRSVLDSSQSSSLGVKRSVARIISNLSLHEHLHQNIYDSGLINILFDWSRSDDLALTLYATKALANLDSDFSNNEKYEDGVLLCHPLYRHNDDIKADIVFVHGLLGGPFRTWRQQDVLKSNNKSFLSKPTEVSEPYTYCWPKNWLAADVGNVRILTVEYETHLSEWAPKCPYDSEKRSLPARSNDLLRKLKSAGVGNRPVIWVGHSMGGLIIKQMLSTATEDKDPHSLRIVEQTCGAVFFSVPHNGSPLAAYGNLAKRLFIPSVEVEELKQGNLKLQQLHKDFCELMSQKQIPLLSFGEGEKVELPLSIRMLLVPESSSSMYYVS